MLGAGDRQKRSGMLVNAMRVGAAAFENPPQDYVGNDNVSPDRMYATPTFDPAKYPAYYAFDPGRHTNTRQLRMIELLEDAHGISDKVAIQITMDEKVFGVDQWAGMFTDAQAFGRLG